MRVPSATAAAAASPVADGARRARAPWALRALVALVPVLLGALYLRDGLAEHGRLAFPLDDPYIHLQFARNLATGHGLSFNPGEPTPGATSPLWVVLLAGVHLAGLPLEWAAVVLGIACAALTAVLTLEAGRAVGFAMPLATLAAVATGAIGRFTWASLSGMEPCLAAALAMLLLTLAIAAPRRPWRLPVMGLVAGLATQARPELIVLALLVGAAELMRAWRDDASGIPHTRRVVAVLPYLALLALVMMPYAVFCHATTGRWLPNTYYAKSVIPIELRPDLTSARRTRYIADAAVWLWRDDVVTALAAGLGLVLWGLRRRPALAWLVPVWPLAFYATSWVSSPLHFNLSRYTIPLIPCVMLTAMAAFHPLLDRLRAPRARRAGIALVALAVLAGAGYRQWQYHGVYQANVDNIVKMQVAMGEWVRRELPAGAVVATNDIGAITWYGGHPCVDTEGLVSSDLVTWMLARLRARTLVSIDDALLEYLPRKRPAYVIVFPDWHPTLVRAPWLERVYAIDYPNNTGGGNELVVYRVRPDRQVVHPD